ncbi:MAG: type VI secretion system-associated FHA domain protein TagH [Spongiibacteraceae bacterium]|nr:type VI secretion system-associated FHA domain protein TagH [Spongiibacteraceae bacterium]
MVLNIVSDPSHENTLNLSKTFSTAGGTLGRSEKNTWVLIDEERIVSSVHARIGFANGQFIVTDESTNGTYLNDAFDPIGPGNQQAIKQGDTLSVGDYKISVTVNKSVSTSLPEGLEVVDFLDNADQGAAPVELSNSADTGVEKLDEWLTPGAPSAQAAVQEDVWGVNALSLQNKRLNPLDHVETDPLSAMDKHNKNLAAPASSLWGEEGDAWWKEDSQPDHSPALHQAMVTAKAPEPVEEVAPVQPEPSTPPVTPWPDEIDSASNEPLQTVSAIIESKPSAPRVEQAPPVRSAKVKIPAQGLQRSEDIADMLGLSNLSEQQLQSLMPELVNIILETINRLVDLQSARTTIKNELRVQRTMIQAVDNNPLKFSVDAANAMRTMFNNDGQSFLAHAQAVADSFDDLSDHQVAVLSGMRAAYETMFSFFSPEKLENRFNRFIGGGLFRIKKAKYWEAYHHHYKTLGHDAEKTYQQLFGDSFAQAYEKQLSELKAARSLTPNKNETDI